MNCQWNVDCQWNIAPTYSLSPSANGRLSFLYPICCFCPRPSHSRKPTHFYFYPYPRLSILSHFHHDLSSLSFYSHFSPHFDYFYPHFYPHVYLDFHPYHPSLSNSYHLSLPNFSHPSAQRLSRIPAALPSENPSCVPPSPRKFIAPRFCVILCVTLKILQKLTN